MIVRRIFPRPNPVGFHYGKGDTMLVKIVTNRYVDEYFVESDTVYVRYNPKKRK